MRTKWGNVNINDSGYYLICSQKEGNYGKRLHRLIYEDEVGPIPEGHVIHHKDGDRLNNKISNLECLSQFEHKSLHSKEQWHGENNYMSKLTEHDVKLILRMLRTGKLTQKRIGEIMGVQANAISRIKNKRRWGHVSI